MQKHVSNFVCDYIKMRLSCNTVREKASLNVFSLNKPWNSIYKSGISKRTHSFV